MICGGQHSQPRLGRIRGIDNRHTGYLPHQRHIFIALVGRSILTDEDIDAFADAGADIILMPAPGTVPGVTQEMVGALAAHAHQLGKLALSSIGTSQEGADVQTIRSIALMSKMAGIDIHHIGDSGYTGIAVPENLIAYSEAIRGRRHTLRDMARSRLR